ncbi:peptide deformylase [Pseudomonadota bacterium]
MIKEILQRGDENLTKRSEEVTDFEVVKGIIQDMKDTIAHAKTLYDFTRGIGLAAPQIGELVRITIIESEGTEYVLINPRIIKTSEQKVLVWDGCLSFFEFRANVPRFSGVTVQAQDIEGGKYELEAEGDFAAAIQHEIDHLDGILYISRLPNGEKDLKKSNKA